MNPRRTGRRYRLIVFDWDGTLVDSENRIVNAALHAIQAMDLPPRSRAEIADIIGLGFREALERLYPQGGDTLHARFVEFYRRRFHTLEAAPLFPQVEQALSALREAAYALAVATGKSRFGLDRELESTGLRDIFDATRCADETASKPDPLMLEELMDELEVKPTGTLMVGDTQYDLEMARNAGVDAVAVSYGVHDRGRLLEFEPLVCLGSLMDLRVWLEQARAGPGGI